MKNNSDCLFGPTIGQRHKYPSNGPSASYPVAFLVGCVELGVKRTGNEWFFKMAGGKSKQKHGYMLPEVSTSNSPKNQGETGIFAEDKAEIKDKVQQN